MDSHDLDSLLPSFYEPTTPQPPHATIPETAAAAVNKLHAAGIQRDMNNMTPPPSTQVPSSQKSKSQRTPTPPVSHISTPPPTIEMSQSQPSRPATAGMGRALMTDEQLANAPAEELRTKVTELHAMLAEAKTSAAHYKLQYNMLSQSSQAAIDRMKVEAQMAQSEDEVLYRNGQTRAVATPIQQSPVRIRDEGSIPVEKDLYQRLLRELNALRQENWSLKDEVRQRDRVVVQQENEVASLTDKVTMLQDRIRSQRESSRHRTNTTLRLESTPRSLYNTPHRGGHRAHTHAQEHAAQPFAALLQASEMASQQQARSYGGYKKGHARNTHSMSSLPATPQHHRKQQQQMVYSTPQHQQVRQGLMVPSTAPVQRTSAIRTPDVYAQRSLPMTQPDLSGHQSDGTVSASDHNDDSEAETDIIEPEDIDTIPESQASMNASQMLRSSQEEQKSARNSFREELGAAAVLPPSSSTRPTGGNGGALKQTKLFGAIRKSNVDRGDEPPSKRARTKEPPLVGLGIGGVGGN